MWNVEYRSKQFTKACNNEATYGLRSILKVCFGVTGRARGQDSRGGLVARADAASLVAHTPVLNHTCNCGRPSACCDQPQPASACMKHGLERAHPAKPATQHMAANHACVPPTLYCSP